MLPILEIIRLEDSEDGVFGVLKINKKVFCVTLELPDRLNAQNISCIPAQQYICKRFDSSRYGKTWQATNVPGRCGVLFHSGNIVDHTWGCILLGEYFGKLQGDRAILNSGKTFKRFIEKLDKYSQLHLTIKDCY